MRLPASRRVHRFIAIKKTLAALAGLPLLLLVVTGFVMWIRPKLRRARRGMRGAAATG